MTKKSKITPVPTVFHLRHYQSTNHQKIVPPKEYCRHGVILDFILLQDHHLTNLNSQVTLYLLWLTNIYILKTQCSGCVCLSKINWKDYESQKAENYHLASTQKDLEQK